MDRKANIEQIIGLAEVYRVVTSDPRFDDRYYLSNLIKAINNLSKEIEKDAESE